MRKIEFPFPPVRRALHLTTSIIVAGIFLVGCDSDPTDLDDDHVEASGFAIEADGVEILRYLDGDGGNPALTLEVGTTYELAIVLLDPEGDPLPHEEHEEGEEEDELEVTIGNPSILSWTPEEHTEEEEHDHLEFHGELEALGIGDTTMLLCLAHEDHCDFTSPEIDVTIE